MRTALLVLGIIVVGLLAAWALVDWRVELPPIGPSVEQICTEMQRRAPDFSWVAPRREESVRDREIKTATRGELPSYSGSLVRVAGVLHTEFEWVAL